MCFDCPQTFLCLDFQCRNDVSESKKDVLGLKGAYGDDNILWVGGGVEGILDAGLLLSSTGTCSASFCSS